MFKPVYRRLQSPHAFPCYTRYSSNTYPKPKPVHLPHLPDTFLPLSHLLSLSTGIFTKGIPPSDHQLRPQYAALSLLKNARLSHKTERPFPSSRSSIPTETDVPYSPTETNIFSTAAVSLPVPIPPALNEASSEYKPPTTGLALIKMEYSGTTRWTGSTENAQTRPQEIKLDFPAPVTFRARIAVTYFKFRDIGRECRCRAWTEK